MGDFVFGRAGDDTIAGNGGPDALLGGGHGNDRLHALADDDDVDTLDCGENADDRDRAVMRRGDAAVNCERVRILPAS
jgi:RTX calcium-binding nonapeptide repeat (4 copies)